MSIEEIEEGIRFEDMNFYVIQSTQKISNILLTLKVNCFLDKQEETC